MLVYLTPHSTFPKLHSDTLFGAISFAINEIYPEILDQMLLDFKKGNPPFILSSAFPFIKDNDKIIRFYPKPNLGNDLSSFDSDLLKKYKKVEYLDEQLFLDLLYGNLTEKELLINFADYYNKKFKSFLSSEPLTNVFFARNIISNNMINRLTNETEIFYSEGDSYNNSGLFFLVEFFDNKYEKIFKNSIKFLCDRGFGKDISVGKGHFDYIIDKNNYFDLTHNGKYFMTLSRFIPTTDELDKINEFSFYSIGSKRGRHSSGDIKKQVRFFTEGSTFPNYKFNYGKMVDVGINVKSVEYGYAFPVTYDGGDLNGL